MEQVLTDGLLIFPLCLQKVKYMHPLFHLIWAPFGAKERDLNGNI